MTNGADPQERGGVAGDPEHLRDGLGGLDARGMTAIEREFVGGRLTTGGIDAQQGLPGGLWSIRYCQDVPRLLREVVSLRAQLAERDAQLAEVTAERDRLQDEVNRAAVRLDALNEEMAETRDLLLATNRELKAALDQAQPPPALEAGRQEVGG